MAIDRVAFYGVSAAAYGFILFALAALEEVLMRGLWRPYDIASYYGLADSAVSSIGAILDSASSPPMLSFGGGFFTGYRIFAVAALCLVSAMLVLETGRRLYGSEAGFMAGLLFALNIAGAQGNMTAAEAMAFTMTLLSAYILLFNGRYAVPGLCAGAAICFKPLAALLLPASLLYAYKKGGPGGLISFAMAALLPLLLISVAAFMVYGGNTLTVALDSGFEAIGLLKDSPPDALMAIASIVLSACLLASLLPLALLGYSRGPGLPEKYLIVSGLCFLATIPLKQYFHYWPFALPFLALLCARAFGRRPSHG